MTTTATLAYTIAQFFGSTAALDAQLASVPLPAELIYNVYGLRFISDTTAALTRTIVLGTGPSVVAGGVVTLEGGSEGSPVASVAISTSGGLDYTLPPNVTIVPAAGDGGSGAKATATMDVGHTIIVSGGAGYVAPTVAFVGGLAPGGVAATATATVTLGVITGITILTHGNGYTTVPSVVITDTAGTGAVVLATLSVNGFVVTNPGLGYSKVPSVVITPRFQQYFPTAALQAYALTNLMTAAIQRLALQPVVATPPVVV